MASIRFFVVFKFHKLPNLISDQNFMDPYFLLCFVEIQKKEQLYDWFIIQI